MGDLFLCLMNGVASVFPQLRRDQNKHVQVCSVPFMSGFAPNNSTCVLQFWKGAKILKTSRIPK